jgi:hypothetical protein
MELAQANTTNAQLRFYNLQSLTMGQDKLSTWGRQVQDDQAPDFEANLLF